MSPCLSLFWSDPSVTHREKTVTEKNEVMEITRELENVWVGMREVVCVEEKEEFSNPRWPGKTNTIMSEEAQMKSFSASAFTVIHFSLFCLAAVCCVSMSRRLNNRQSELLFVQNLNVNLESTSNTPLLWSTHREEEMDGKMKWHKKSRETGK